MDCNYCAAPMTPALLNVPGEGRIQPGFTCDSCEVAVKVKGRAGQLPA